MSCIIIAPCVNDAESNCLWRSFQNTKLVAFLLLTLHVPFHASNRSFNMKVCNCKYIGEQMGMMMSRPSLQTVSGEQYPHGDYDDDDINIMVKCLSVCLSRKMITSHFRAERRRHEVSCPLGLAGFGLVMMMMMMTMATEGHCSHRL